MPRLRDAVRRLLHRPLAPRAAQGAEVPARSDAELLRLGQRAQTRRQIPFLVGCIATIAGVGLSFGLGAALIMFGLASILLGIGSAEPTRGR